MTVELYEDNAGQLYMRRDGDNFYLADVEYLEDGTFADNAAHFVEFGAWELPTYDGAAPGLLVAVWRDGNVTVLRNEYSGEVLAGFAAQAFIGIEREL